jgi:hypothetical protein
MNNRILAIAVGSVILVSTAFSAESPKITASSAELTASDLASAMGVRWWSYKLRFDQPVSSVFVRLCELRRQPDGSWQRTQLASGHGFKHETADAQEVAVAVLIQDKATDYDLSLRVGSDVARTKFTTKPDFSHTYSQPTSGRIVSGCLVLAIEEKDPQVATGREQNFVRMIALEIETE